MACLFHTSGKMVPPSILPLRHDKRSLAARGRAKGGCQRARSFDSRAIKSREKRGFARRLSSFYPFTQSIAVDFLCGFLGTKNYRIESKRACLLANCALYLAIFGFRRVAAAELGGSCFVLLIVALV